MAIYSDIAITVRGSVGRNTGVGKMMWSPYETAFALMLAGTLILIVIASLGGGSDGK
jgi:hypothetical protein